MDDPSGSGAEAVRVLVVLAHPDDPEFFCGATIAQWAAEGREINYCLLTRGDKGADDGRVDPHWLSRTREEEQRAAASVLGVKDVLFLDYPDGYLTPDLSLRKDIVRVIRRFRPHIVVTGDPTNFFPSDRYINHPDHRAAGQATLDAVFPAAGSALFFPELAEQEALAPHKVGQVYIAMPEHPNMILDVTQYLERKLEALRRHSSQVGSGEELERVLANVRKRMLDPASPSESPRYVERFRRIDMTQ
jgi:LmbE family N-acetylglucosaminyl deacetylase